MWTIIKDFGISVTGNVTGRSIYDKTNTEKDTPEMVVRRQYKDPNSITDKELYDVQSNINSSKQQCLNVLQIKQKDINLDEFTKANFNNCMKQKLNNEVGKSYVRKIEEEDCNIHNTPNFI